MADAAFGVVGVVSLAIQVGQSLDKLRRDFKDVPDDLKRFHTELSLHRANLDSTQAILRRAQDNGQQCGSDCISSVPGTAASPAASSSAASSAASSASSAASADEDWTRQCHAELSRVLDEITVPKTSLRRRWGRIKKTLRSDALKESMARLHRCCDQVNQNVNVQSLDAALQIQEALRSISAVQLKDQHRALLGWLSAFDHTRRQQDLLSKWHAGTVDGIFEQTAFIEWCEGCKDDESTADSVDAESTPVAGSSRELACLPANASTARTPSPPIIWYHGGPGVGKSVMTSRVVHDLQEQRPPDVALLYLYCDYKDRSNQDILSLLSSLVRQATEQALELQKALPPAVGDIYQHYAEGQTGHITLGEAETLLVSLLDMFRRAFILLDGLDEFVNGADAGYQAQKPAEVLKRVYGVFERCQPTVRLFLTSREHTTLLHPTIPALKIPMEAKESDLQAYVGSYIARDEFYLCAEVKSRAGLEDQIINKIVDKASGQFLLASLTVQDLGDKGNIRDLKEALEHLPVDHIERYREAIERIDSQRRKTKRGMVVEPLGIHVIGIVLHARRSLEVEEMQHALAVRPGDSEFQQDGIYRHEHILGGCAGLVRLSIDAKFEFVHNSVVEFLQTHELYVDRFAALEQSLVDRCIGYMTLQDFAEPTDDLVLRRRAFPFLPYAVDNFGSHASSCIKLDSGLLPGYVKFMREDIQPGALQCFAAKVLQSPSPRRIPGWRSSLNDLHISIVFGLVEATRYILEEGAVDIEHPGYKKETALHMAARSGNLDAVKLLLEKGASVKRRSGSGKNALDVVLHEPFMRLVLLSTGFPKQSAIDLYRPPEWSSSLVRTTAISTVSLDITDTQEAIAHVLIDAGADLNSEGPRIPTPLQLASIYERDQLVWHLLEKGANPWVDHELGLLAPEIYALRRRQQCTMAGLLQSKMKSILALQSAEPEKTKKALIPGPCQALEINGEGYLANRRRLHDSMRQVMAHAFGERTNSPYHQALGSVRALGSSNCQIFHGLYDPSTAAGLTGQFRATIELGNTELDTVNLPELSYNGHPVMGTISRLPWASRAETTGVGFWLSLPHDRPVRVQATSMSLPSARAVEKSATWQRTAETVETSPQRTRGATTGAERVVGS